MRSPTLKESRRVQGNSRYYRWHLSKCLSFARRQDVWDDTLWKRKQFAKLTGPCCPPSLKNMRIVRPWATSWSEIFPYWVLCSQAVNSNIDNWFSWSSGETGFTKCLSSCSVFSKYPFSQIILTFLLSMAANSNVGWDQLFSLRVIMWIFFTQNHKNTYTQTQLQTPLVSSGGTQVQAFEKASQVMAISCFSL